MASSILTETPELNYTEPSDYFNPEAFTALVENRRSSRLYTDEKVPEEIIHKCLDLALLAPNSSNMQPWEFYWVRSEEKRKKLNAYCLDQNAAKTAPEIIVAVARRDTWKRNAKLMLEEFGKQDEEVPKAATAYYKKLAPLAYNQGFLGMFGMIKRVAFNVMAINKPMVRQPKSISDMRVWSNKSTALACENLMLAFRAYGYDTCPMEGLDQRRVRKLLNLPYGKAEVCMAISVGKRADNGIYGPRIRFDRELFVKEV
ncbi:MAG: nitroreductase family protein [Crocinitomicaceae bacterium]|nr:nitroreductase family protein [Crocinitomicaceae bacterium]